MLQFLVLMLIVGLVINNVIDITFAAITNDDPDVIITIGADKQIAQEGNLFGDGLWYPGREASGVLRIANNFNQIKVSSLGLDVKLESIKDGYDEDTVYNSFLSNMKLTIKKGRLLVFEDKIVDNMNFGELLYKSGSDTHKGYVLKDTHQFNISNGDHVDLEYTLSMDNEAGKELQDISSSVDFLINVAEISTDDGGDGGGGSSGGEDDDEENKTVNTVITFTEKQWYHDCIKALLDNGIIQGYPSESMTIEDYRNGTVKPEDYIEQAVQPKLNITRAEAAMLIGKALGLEEVEKFFSGYIDGVPDWAKGYIIATSDKEIFEGYPGNLFRPNNYITREEMTAVLIRAFEKKYEKEIELGFVDKTEIAKWAEEYVKSAVQNKVVDGYPDNTFKPKNNITRAEAFTIICKLLGLHAEH